MDVGNSFTQNNTEIIAMNFGTLLDYRSRIKKATLIS